MIPTRSSWLLMLGAVWAASAPAADSFAVGVLSCAAETDRDRRLDCYDRAVANYTAGLTSSKRDIPAGPAPTVAAGAASGATVAPAASQASASSGASAPLGGSVAAGTTTAGTSTARHVSARIVSIDHFPDYVVLHLDNQQTWKQVSDSPGGLVLRTGDPVTVDKQMGSYWLSGPKGEAVQVKLEAPKP